MFPEIEVKRRLRTILELEESSEEVDWIAIAGMSASLLVELPPALPVIVEAYLRQYPLREADGWFARAQRLELASYLRY